MVDIARLGIAVDSTQVDKGAQSLDKLVAASKRAETAAKGVETSSRSEGAAIKAASVDMENLGRVVDMTARRQDQLKRSTDQAARSIGLARHELINFGRQVQDVGTMLAMGASPMQVITSQAAQVADIFMSTQGTMRGFFGQMATGIRMVLPGMAALGASVAAVGTAAGLAGLAFAQQREQINLALMGVGRGSGMRFGDINAIAGGQNQFSRGDARGIAATFAGAGLNRSLTAGLTGPSTAAFGRLTGQAPAEAAKDLAAAFADPTRGAEKLNERLGFLDGALRQYIATAQAAGDKTAAQTALFRAFSMAVSEAERPLRLYEKIWQGILDKVDAVGSKVANAIDPDKMTQLWRAENDVALLSNMPGGQFLGLDRAIQNRDALRRSIRGDRERDEQGRANAQSRQISDQGSNAVRGILNDIKELQSLREGKSLIDKLIGDKEAMRRASVSLGEATEAQARYTYAIQNFKTAAQQVAQESQIIVQQTLAQTFAERTAAQALQAWVQVMNTSKDSALAAAQAEKVRNEAIAQSIKQAEEAARGARDALGLVGLRGLERTLKEIDNRVATSIRTNAGNPPPVGVPGPSSGAPANNVLANRIGALDAERVAAAAAEQKRMGTATPYLTNDPVEAARRRLAAGLVEFNAGGRSPVTGVPNTGGGNAAGLPTSGRGSAEGFYRQAQGDERQAAIQAATTEVMRDRNRALDEQIRLTELQAEAMMGANQSSQVALERERIMSEFMRNGVNERTIGAQKWRELGQSVDEYAQRTVAAAQRTRELQLQMQNFEQLKGLAGDTLRGIFSDLKTQLGSGVGLWKALETTAVNALDRITSKLLDMAANNYIEKIFGQGTSGAGWLGNIARSLFGGTPNIQGAAAFVGTGTGGLYHSGRGPYESGPRRNVNPAVFMGAPRLHSGVGPGEIPAIIKDDESVLTPAQMRAIGARGGRGGAVTVNVVNQGTPKNVSKQEEEDDGRGGRRIKLVMSDMVAEAVAEPGSAANRAVTSSVDQRVTRR